MMHRPSPAFRLLLATALPLALAACGKDEPKKGGDGRTAEGEILQGSVSDAMLPVDSVRSQPPLAPKSGGGDDKPGSDGSKPGKPDKADKAAKPKPEAAPSADAEQ